jgi:hypothetical protein
MNFKRTGVLALILLVMFVGTANAGYPEPTQLTYNPSPAIPGTTITVFVQLENKDSVAQTGVVVSMDNTYPFTVKGDSSKSVGTIDKYGKASTTFTVYVDPNAENKTYTLPINTSSADVLGVKQATFPIVVSGKEPSLKVIDSSLAKIAPGHEENLPLTIQNIGTSTAYDVVVEMQEDRTVTATGLIVERELSPMGAAAAYITQIGAGEKQVATLKISANRSAELKNYTLPVKVSYRDSTGIRQTDTSYIGLRIEGNVEFDATLKANATPFIAGQKADATIEMFNKGAGSASFVIAEISTTAGTAESSKQFIGSLNPNDVDSFKTGLILNSNLPTGEQILNVTLTYQDTDAQTKKETFRVPIMVYSAVDGAAAVGSGPNPLLILIILVVIAAVGWKLIKRRGKKK